MRSKKGTAPSEIAIAATGAMLATILIVTLIARNWGPLPEALKITILLCATATAYAGGRLLHRMGCRRMARTMLVLGTVSYSLNAILIAQAFLSTGTPWLWTVPIAGMLTAAYLLKPDI